MFFRGAMVPKPPPLTRVELFYDVISPYTWMAFEALIRYRTAWHLDLVLRPFLLGGVIKETGFKGPLSLHPNCANYRFSTDVPQRFKFFGLRASLNEGEEWSWGASAPFGYAPACLRASKIAERLSASGDPIVGGPRFEGPADEAPEAVLPGEGEPSGGDIRGEAMALARVFRPLRLREA
ncbi:unnamed protein product [Cyprideis torosa]|uniref:DSBA-like thioredoxin domain-containing protein n=1 Tax=Cyprideis torosa TaxID=163714 RepID=A0A7R8WJ89_9CRUS|nr:unnamed protein product [Cyprideis torosa]CAG0899784.1 unnamed protein product [Cyprideis torosa]